MSDRRRYHSGGFWEAEFGYCRAVEVDGRILVSGCTSTREGAVHFPADPAAQMRAALDTALTAVRELGGSVADVVRTRTYVTHRRDCDVVGRVHGVVFGEHPPVSTMVIVAGLLHPDMRVEVELEAVLPKSDPRDEG